MGQRNYDEEALRSEFAYRILVNIHRNDERTPSDIADDLDTTYHSVRNYMRGLEDLDIIEIGRKDGRKKYYCINYEALFDIWAKKWNEICGSMQDTEDPDIYTGLEKDYDYSDIQSTLAGEPDQIIKEIIISIFELYLDIVDESTIEDMMVKEFIFGATAYRSYTFTDSFEEKFPDKWTATYLYLYEGYRNRNEAANVVAEVIDRYKEKN